MEHKQCNKKQLLNNYLRLIQQAHHQAGPLSETIYGDPASLFHFYQNFINIFIFCLKHETTVHRVVV